MSNNEGVDAVVATDAPPLLSSSDPDNNNNNNNNSNNNFYCDESKCVGRCLSSNGEMTCYADGNYHPYMCSDGYIPILVENEPTVIMKKSDFNYRLVEMDIVCNYYTCCNNKPEEEAESDNKSNLNITRHCSNSSIGLIIEEESDSDSDSDSDSGTSPTSMMIPLPMKTGKNMNTGKLIESYIACDINSVFATTDVGVYSNINSINSNTHTRNYLNDTECVPYSDQFYAETRTKNVYGYLSAMTCDFDPDSASIMGIFKYPKPIMNEGNSWADDYSHYECCMTPPQQSTTQIQYFLQDKAFKTTVYPQLIVSALAVIACIFLIIGMIIPLCMKIKNNNNATTIRTSGRITSRTGTTTESSTNYAATTTSTRSNNRASRNRSSAARTSTANSASYSSYNLYLVYLALPDLILNIYLLGMYSSYVNQKHNSNYYGIIIWNKNHGFMHSYPFEGAFILACSTANLYLNCIVAYEVYYLLRNSHLLIRSKPPTLLKVTIQSLIVYAFSVVIFLIHYFIGRALRYAIVEEHNKEKMHTLSTINLIWSLIITYVTPIGFVIYICITIFYKGYMPSASGRLKELVWYFFRIVLVFCLFWIPGMALIVYGAANKDGRYIAIGLLFCGIQPILSTGMTMTKSDVRKYSTDLITLSYIRKNNILGLGSTTTTTTSSKAPSNVEHGQEQDQQIAPESSEAKDKNKHNTNVNNVNDDNDDNDDNA